MKLMLKQILKSNRIQLSSCTAGIGTDGWQAAGSQEETREGSPAGLKGSTPCWPLDLDVEPPELLDDAFLLF